MTASPETETILPVRGRSRLRPGGSFLLFFLRRLASLIVLLLGITFIAFVLTELVPSNAAATNLGEQAAADPAAVKAFEQHYGLNKPLPERYLIYLEHLLQGNLGQSSLTHDAVTHDLGQFIPATVESPRSSRSSSPRSSASPSASSQVSGGTSRPTTGCG